MIDCTEIEVGETVHAVILRAAGKTFTASADVFEFDHPPLVPHLPDVIPCIKRIAFRINRAYCCLRSDAQIA